MENENQQVFETNQDVDGFERLDSSSRHDAGASTTGQHVMEAAFGRLESHEAVDDRTPLLATRGEENAQIEQDNGNVESDGRKPPTWEGERDFEGKPWWNRPSV